MPRRVYSYGAEMGWGPLNLAATAGALLIALSVLLFIINVTRSYRHGVAAGDNPWGGGTLEWSVASPPPPSNFHLPPVVHSRFPLWQQGGTPRHVSGLSDTEREILITSGPDARPDHRLRQPEPSAWPFLTAVATTILFIGSIYTPWAVVWGAVPVAAGATLWFWPRGKRA
jgi:cytochrome c oxidase subunit 1